MPINKTNDKTLIKKQKQQKNKKKNNPHQKKKQKQTNKKQAKTNFIDKFKPTLNRIQQYTLKDTQNHSGRKVSS